MVDLLVTVVTRMVLVATTPLAAQMATALAVAAGYWSGFAVNYLGQRNFALKATPIACIRSSCISFWWALTGWLPLWP